MSEEEKEAIEELKQIRNSLYVEEYHYEWQLAIDTILNYIDKIQKELKCEKELRIRYERRYDKCKESKDRLKLKNTELKKELNYYKEDERSWE